MYFDMSKIGRKNKTTDLKAERKSTLAGGMQKIMGCCPWGYEKEEIECGGQGARTQKSGLPTNTRNKHNPVGKKTENF